MPVKKVIPAKIPELLTVSVPTTLFLVGKEKHGERFFAFRSTAPQFAIMGDDLMELYNEGNNIINNFLNKMHRFGFRL